MNSARQRARRGQCHSRRKGSTFYARKLLTLSDLAPRAGFEPATLRLTAGCSTVELPRNIQDEPAAGPSILACFRGTPKGSTPGHSVTTPAPNPALVSTSAVYVACAAATSKTATFRG